MPINEIYPFGSAGTEANGDVLALAEYLADAQRLSGHQLGIARRDLMNTVLRQNSHMAAGLAQFIAARHAPGVVDDGDLDKVEAGLVAAINALILAAQDDTEYALADHTHLATAITNLLTATRSYNAVQAYTPVALTIDAGAVTWNMTAAPVAELALTEDVTNLTIVNAVPGSSPVLRVAQGADWAMAWPAAICWLGGMAHEVSAGAGTVDIIQFDVGSGGVICAQGAADFKAVS